MDNRLAEFLTNEQIPRALRYLTLAAVICFVDWVLLGVAAITPMAVVKVVFYLIAALMLAVGVRLAYVIHRGKQEDA